MMTIYNALKGNLYGVADIMIFIVMDILILMCIVGGISILDSAFGHEYNSTGIIKKLEFVPEHTEIIYIYNAATKTNMPQPHIVDDAWYAHMLYRGKIQKVEISKKKFNELNENSTVNISTRITWIFKRHNIIEIK